MKPIGFLRLLACVLLIVSLLLCGCEQDAEVSSIPSVPTENKAQQMTAAMEKGNELLSRAETLFGAPIFSMSETFGGNGTGKDTLTIRQFSLYGTAHIGNQPLILLRDKTVLEGITHTVGTLSAAGDTVHFASLDGPDGRYLSLPGTDNKSFELTDETETRLGQRIVAIRKALQTPPAEELITSTRKDGGTEYAATAETKDGFPFAFSVFATDNSYTLSVTHESTENGLWQLSFSMSKAGSNLSFRLEVTDNGKTLLESSGTVTVSRKSMIITGTFAKRGKQTAFDIALSTESADKVTFTGTVTDSFSDLSVPMQLTGELASADGKLCLSASLQASLTGTLTFDMAFESAFTPGTPELSTDFEGVELTKTDADGLVDSLREVYPHATALYDALFRGENTPPTEISSVTYRDESGSLVLTLYGDETVGLSLQGDFSMLDGILTLSYNEHTLFSVPYTVNENGTYTIWNAVFTKYADGTLAHLSPGGSNWMELMPVSGDEGSALLDLCLPATVADGTLNISLPNGSTLSLPYTSDSYRLSAMLWDIPLKYAMGDA